MWRQRKTWEGPRHPWQKQRLLYEKELMKKYGLKNKREIWKAATIARKIRKYVRHLFALKALGVDVSKEEQIILQKLKRYGLIPENGTLEDALNITVETILERRLQTIVWRRGLARTPRQARQLIVHGHIVVGEQVITSPGYLVKKEEEDKITYHPLSPLANPEHPLRKAIEGKLEEQKEETEEKKEEQKEKKE